MSVATKPRYVLPAEAYRDEAGEAGFHAMILEMLAWNRWTVHFLPDWLYRLAIREAKAKPRKGYRWPEPGFPDIVAGKEVGEPGTDTYRARVLVIELKTRAGRTAKEQDFWLRVLAHVAGDGMDVRVVRPADGDDLEAALRWPAEDAA